MSMHRVIPLLATTLLVASPAVAQADPSDTFLDLLDSASITYVTPSAALLAGHAVCVDLDSGRPADVVAADIWDVTDLSLGQSRFFVAASIAAFCPGHNATMGWVV